MDSIPIYPKENIRNLGAIFNNTLDMESLVNTKCKTARHSLRNISRVRRSLTTEATTTLIQAYVSSRLDYCNSLLQGSPAYLVKRIQKVQNYAARVIRQVPKHDHITPILRDLHWLPVMQRIEFKTLLYVFKALNGQAPSYITDLLTPYVPSRNLRSSQKNWLREPSYQLSSYGGRTFMAAAPRLWNILLESIKQASSMDIFFSNAS